MHFTEQQRNKLKLIVRYKRFCMKYYINEILDNTNEIEKVVHYEIDIPNLRKFLILIVPFSESNNG